MFVEENPDSKKKQAHVFLSADDENVLSEYCYGLTKSLESIQSTPDTEFCFLINEEDVTISKDFHSEIYDIFRLSFWMWKHL